MAGRGVSCVSFEGIEFRSRAVEMSNLGNHT
jgi:hypothetical protein